VEPQTPPCQVASPRLFVESMVTPAARVTGTIAKTPPVTVWTQDPLSQSHRRESQISSPWAWWNRFQTFDTLMGTLKQFLSEWSVDVESTPSDFRCQHRR
jgi:hypothetical protein